MTILGRNRWAAAMGLVVASGAWFDSTARGQVVAFQPQVSTILNGTAMQVTPAVSADRRYVRVSVNAYFQTVNGFTTYTAPLGAVSGGGIGSIGGSGGGGGIGGGGGGLGGAGGGIGGVGGGVGAGGGFAGMNGPIAGVGMAGPMGSMTGYGQTGSYLAGDFPPAPSGLGMGSGGTIDPFGQSGVIPMRAGMPDAGLGDPVVAGNVTTADPFGFADVPEEPSMRPAKRTAASRRQAAARKSSRRPTSKAKSRN